MMFRLVPDPRGLPTTGEQKASVFVVPTGAGILGGRAHRNQRQLTCLRKRGRANIGYVTGEYADCIHEFLYVKQYIM